MFRFRPTRGKSRAVWKSKAKASRAKCYTGNMRVLIACIIATAGAATSSPAQTTDERAWQALEQAVHDSNPLKRMQAVQAMGILLPQSRVLAILDNALADKQSTVREAACGVLGTIKARNSIPKLETALEDNTPEVVFAAAKALYAMGNPKGRAVMMEILLGEQRDASGFVSSSIRSMRLKLHDPRAMALMGLKEGAGFAGPFGMGVPVAVGLTQDSQASGKTAAAILLANDTSPSSLNALREALAEKNWTVRAAAARAIGMRDAVSLYKDVAPLLDDKRGEVKYSAAAALIRLKQKAVARPRRAPNANE